MQERPVVPMGWPANGSSPSTSTKLFRPSPSIFMFYLIRILFYVILMVIFNVLILAISVFRWSGLALSFINFYYISDLGPLVLGGKWLMKIFLSVFGFFGVLSSLPAMNSLVRDQEFRVWSLIYSFHPPSLVSHLYLPYSWYLLHFINLVNLAIGCSLSSLLNGYFEKKKSKD